jgi:CO dehydrogenase maturation factor
LLGQLARPDRVVVADFEAGLGTIMRLDGNPVDVVVVVVEPTAKSLEVGRRAAESVREGGLGRVVIIANRVRDDDDVARVRAALPAFEPVLVPDDPAIVAAERQGAAPLDSAPDAPAVRALVSLANDLGKARR